MPNDLQVIDAQFRPLMGHMAEALPPSAGIGPERIVQSILIACEKNTAIMECDRPSLQQAAFSACALGLLVDGVTGQGYIVPYRGKAQFQIGVKGYSTIAGRSKFMLGGNAIYEGEQHSIILGTGGHAWVKPNWTLRGDGTAKIVAAFATLESHHAPTAVDAMGLDEIMRIRKMSKATRDDSPWNTHFAQMAIKTAKKRLAKNCPLDILQLAGALDDAADQGKHAYIRPQDRALMVDHVAEPLTPMQPQPPTAFSVDETAYGIIDANGQFHDVGTADNWRAQIEKRVLTLQSDEQIGEFVIRNRTVFDQIAKVKPAMVDDVRLRLAERIDEIRRG